MMRVIRGAVAVLVTLGLAGCQQLVDSLGGCVEVKGSFNPATPSVLVRYQTGVDPVATTKSLEAKYDFSARHVYTAALSGFAAQLSDAALAGVRCESTVAEIERDAVATIQ